MTTCLTKSTSRADWIISFEDCSDKLQLAAPTKYATTQEINCYTELLEMRDELFIGFTLGNTIHDLNNESKYLITLMIKWSESCKITDELLDLEEFANEF